MPYLIDGHNLIGQLPDLDLTDPNDEAKLVERLKSFMGHKRARCTVIFDGGLPGGRSRDLSTYSVRVVFAHGGTNADAIILERIRTTRDSGALIIVSADHAIVDEARRRRMRVIAPRAFADEMNAPPVPDDNDPNPHVSPKEVQEWLALFGEDPDEE